MDQEIDFIYDYRFNINYYGADYPIDTLVRKLDNEEIYIPTFQRQYVWKIKEASLFIESILLGLPIPNVFLAKDKYTNKLLIIDGQQRLKTLLYFTRGKFPNGKKFKLTGVIPQFNGLTFEDLDSKDKYNLMDYTIHATVIAESGDTNRMYYLFERLNTTGTPLTAQEIRNAIYHGPFCDLIGHLSENDEWKAVYGKKDLRLKGQELILRFFALHFNIDQYHGDMKNFLNEFMLRNRLLEEFNQDDLSYLFSYNIRRIYEVLGTDSFKFNKVFNTAFYEAIMLSLVNIKGGLSQHKIVEWHSLLKQSEEFKSLIQTRTTQKEVLLNRMYFAKNILERIV